MFLVQAINFVQIEMTKPFLTSQRTAKVSFPCWCEKVIRYLRKLSPPPLHIACIREFISCHDDYCILSSFLLAFAPLPFHHETFNRENRRKSMKNADPLREQRPNYSHLLDKFRHHGVV